MTSRAKYNIKGLHNSARMGRMGERLCQDQWDFCEVSPHWSTLMPTW